MSILLDTNVLLRRVQPSHPSHVLAVDSVARLLAAGEAVHFTLQNIAEFWNVATRPAEHNGLGFPAAVALVEVEKVEAAFDLLPNTPSIYAAWRDLVLRHGVTGAKVHDARLGAAMNVHGVRRLLTFNARRFHPLRDRSGTAGRGPVLKTVEARIIRVQRMTRKWGPVRRLGRSRWRRISTNESPGFQDFEAEISLIFPRAATSTQPYLSAAAGMTRARPMNFSGSWGSLLTRTS